MKLRNLLEANEPLKRLSEKRLANYNAHRDRQRTIRRQRNKSFLVAALPTVLWLAFLAYTLNESYNQTWLIVGTVMAYSVFSLVSLLFYDGPVRDFLVYMFTASIKWPGLMYSFDWDGFLWVIMMKALFAILGFKRNIMVLFGVVILAVLTLGLCILFLPIGIIIPFTILFSLGGFMGTYAAYPKIKQIMIDPYYNDHPEEKPEDY